MEESIGEQPSSPEPKTKSQEEKQDPLKAFSDEQLLEELEERLLGNPNVDAEVLKRLKTIAIELEKRIEAKAKTEAVEAKLPVEQEKNPIENQGKKWAKIIREKGVGSLSGKFREDWGYVGKDGRFYKCGVRGIGFTATLAFGVQDKEDERFVYFFHHERLMGGIIDVAYNNGLRSYKNPTNFLLMERLPERPGRFNKGLVCLTIHG